MRLRLGLGVVVRGVVEVGVGAGIGSLGGTGVDREKMGVVWTVVWERFMG